MPNYYTEFSAQIENLTPPEEIWLKKAIPLLSKRLYRQVHGDMIDEVDLFGWGIQPEPTEGLSLWIYGEDGRDDVDAALDIVQAFLRKFRPKEIFSMGWSFSCGRPVLDAFGGGAAVVTAEEMEWINTVQWMGEAIERQKARLAAKGEHHAAL
jgi:hypothetical protein